MLLSLLIVSRGGSLFKHALGVMLLAWRRMLLAGAAALVAGLLVGETGAVLVTGRVPPPVVAQVPVAIFATVVAYAAAVTVFLEELLHGIIATIRLVEGDTVAGARAAAVAAEREAGEVGTGLMRLFGMGRRTAPSATTTTGAFAGPAVTVTRTDDASQTAADIAATDEFVTTAPRPKVNARPVRADQLPRIGWTVEEPAARGDAPAGERSPAPGVLPPLPVQAPNAAARGEETGDTPAATDGDGPAAPASESAMGRQAAPDTRPLPPEHDDVWTPPSSVVVLPPKDAPSEFGEAGRPTRPLSRPNSRPLADDQPRQDAQQEQ